MSKRMSTLVVALVVGSFSLGSVGLASAGVDAAVPATETLYISAGCPSDTPGTCTSTRWLGKTSGDATTNFVTAVTPVDEVFYQAEGSLNWRDYASDDSLREAGYPLRAAEQIKATVALESEGPGVNMTVHARIEATTATNQTITFGPLEQTLTMMPASTAAVPFAFDIPDELEGAVVKSMTFYMALHGVNLNAGYINQAGGSTVEIPYTK